MSNNLRSFNCVHPQLELRTHVFKIHQLCIQTSSDWTIYTKIPGARHISLTGCNLGTFLHSTLFPAFVSFCHSMPPPPPPPPPPPGANLKGAQFDNSQRGGVGPREKKEREKRRDGQRKGGRGGQRVVCGIEFVVCLFVSLSCIMSGLLVFVPPEQRPVGKRPPACKFTRSQYRGGQFTGCCYLNGFSPRIINISDGMYLIPDLLTRLFIQVTYALPMLTVVSCLQPNLTYL